MDIRKKNAKMYTQQCSIDGCERPYSAKGLCRLHHERKRRHGTTDSPIPTLSDRFFSRYIPVPESGCWLWEGAANAQGYGSISVNDKEVKAHRVSWELHNGPITGDLLVLHKCDTPSCVNPDHLFLGNHRDNMMDAIKKGRANLSNLKYID